MDKQYRKELEYGFNNHLLSDTQKNTYIKLLKSENTELKYLLKTTLPIIDRHIEYEALSISIAEQLENNK